VFELFPSDTVNEMLGIEFTSAALSYEFDQMGY
jgi:hypothetical protein